MKFASDGENSPGVGTTAQRSPRQEAAWRHEIPKGRLSHAYTECIQRYPAGASLSAFPDPVCRGGNAFGLGESYDSTQANVTFRVYSSRATRIDVDIFAPAMNSSQVLSYTLKPDSTTNILLRYDTGINAVWRWHQDRSITAIAPGYAAFIRRYSNRVNFAPMKSIFAKYSSRSTFLTAPPPGRTSELFKPLA